MGVYAQSDVEIVCKDRSSAVRVYAELLNKTNEEGCDFYITLSEMDDESAVISGGMSSGRIQNLEYQCEQLWEFIKGMEGVQEMSCPFLVEGDGMSFYNEEE